jgi:hypothetical protein
MTKKKEKYILSTGTVSGHTNADQKNGQSLNDAYKITEASENSFTPHLFTPEKDMQSLMCEPSILVVGQSAYYGAEFQGKNLLYCSSVISAMGWMKVLDTNVKEIWLDFEVPFESFEVEKTERPVGGFDNEARAFITYLDDWSNYWHSKIERIRINTMNPVGIQYIRLALERKYDLCLHMPTRMQ